MNKKQLAALQRANEEARNKPFTVADLKRVLEEMKVLDTAEIFVPIWGHRSEPVEDIYYDEKDNRLNIIANVE